jgi:hypothetical protein
MTKRFRDWLEIRMLQEVGTGSNAVAVFSRPIFGEPFQRRWPGPWGEEDPFFRKQREKKQRNYDW